MSRRASDYRFPRADSPDDLKVGHFNDIFQQAQAFLQSQRAFPDIQLARDFIAGPENERLPESYSRVDLNMGKRQIRENVATLSNVRPLWGFHTDQKELQPLIAYRNRMLSAWHQNTYFDRSLEDVLKFTGTEGTGYARPYWDPNHYTPGRGEILVAAYGASQVFPFMIGKDRDIQKAYCVIIHHEVPLHQAHDRWPTKAHLITPDREAPGGLLKNVVGRIQRFLSPALNVGGMGRTPVSDSALTPVADIYEVIVLDGSINESDREMAFGKPDSSWFYKVPYIGMEIPAGYRNSAGQVLYRKATPEDCRMYPLRRSMFFSSKCCLEDDTQQEWHGKVPLVKFQLDSWPWEYLGFGMPRDYRPTQESNRRILRGIDDKINAGLNPALQYNDGTVARALVEELDVRQPGQSVGVDMGLGTQIAPLLPADYYRVDAAVYQHVEWMFQQASYLIGAPALAGLASLRQMPSDQTQEKFAEAMGALVWDYSREVERGLSEFGNLWGAMSFQRYDAKRTTHMTEIDGVTDGVINWEPEGVIPSHLPNEDRQVPSDYNWYQRARFYMDKMYMQIKPMTSHQVTQISHRLFLERLREQNFPIDPQTLASASDIPNFGIIPGATVLERYINWKQLEAAIQAKAIKLAQEGLARGNATDPNAEGGAAVAAAAGPPNPEGRPPTGTDSMRLKEKSDGKGGNRTSITQS